MPDLWPADYLLSVCKQVQVGASVVCALAGQRHVQSGCQATPSRRRWSCAVPFDTCEMQGNFWLPQF